MAGRTGGRSSQVLKVLQGARTTAAAPPEHHTTIPSTGCAGERLVLREMQLQQQTERAIFKKQAKSDSTYQRFMRDADNLLAWDVPGQATQSRSKIASCIAAISPSPLLPGSRLGKSAERIPLFSGVPQVL